MSTATAIFPTVSDIFARRGSGGCYPSIADNIDASGDCWEWTSHLNTAGYGQVGFFGRRTLVHRLMWEALVGPIPLGLEMDHLCRNRRCVNPDHLEPVTSSVNSQRGYLNPPHVWKSHCLRGHPFTGDNIYLYPNGNRACRACRRHYAGKRRR